MADDGARRVPSCVAGPPETVSPEYDVRAGITEDTSGFGRVVTQPSPPQSTRLDRSPPTYWIEDSVTRREIWAQQPRGKLRKRFPRQGEWLLRLDLNQQPSG